MQRLCVCVCVKIIKTTITCDLFFYMFKLKGKFSGVTTVIQPVNYIYFNVLNKKSLCSAALITTTLTSVPVRSARCWRRGPWRPRGPAVGCWNTACCQSCSLPPQQAAGLVSGKRGRRREQRRRSPRVQPPRWRRPTPPESPPQLRELWQEKQTRAVEQKPGGIMPGVCTTRCYNQLHEMIYWKQMAKMSRKFWQLAWQLLPWWSNWDFREIISDVRAWCSHLYRCSMLKNSHQNIYEKI